MEDTTSTTTSAALHGEGKLARLPYTQAKAVTMLYTVERRLLLLSLCLNVVLWYCDPRWLSALTSSFATLCYLRRVLETFMHFFQLNRLCTEDTRY